MRDPNLEQVFADLLQWCRSRDFAGYDPFDALNSRIFQATPLKRSRIMRQVWTQLCKRCWVNLRPLALVPAQRNAKAIALFALAALANYRKLKTIEAEMEARDVLDELLEMRIQGYSGAAWGYNFDWQSRHFFAPQGTPTIVPTAFAVRALIEAYQAFGDERYLQIAQSSCRFVLEDLNRSVDSADEVCFSYSPLDHTKIFNASLFAAEILASLGSLAGERELCNLAIRAARYVVKQQRENGCWIYGAEPAQQWTDNFHTAYVLLSLSRIMKFCTAARLEFDEALRRGYEFWRERFFLADGWPKYYDDTLYPADAHAAATAIVALVELREFDGEALALAEKITGWILRNLHDKRGFFYYQRWRFYCIHTAYMRWTEAWMAYALARLLEEKHGKLLVCQSPAESIQE
jgi:hypothetical protein